MKTINDGGPGGSGVVWRIFTEIGGIYVRILSSTCTLYVKVHIRSIDTTVGYSSPVAMVDCVEMVDCNV